MTAARPGIGASGRPRKMVGRGVAGILLTGVTTGVVRRMERDFTATGRLRSSTSGLVYATYGAHVVMTALAARRPVLPLPAPTKGSAVLGTAVGAAGVGVFTAGAGVFPTAAQVSGTQAGELVTDGIYRWSRNPQYLAYLLGCVGFGLARRSGDALVLASWPAIVFAYWIRREEANLGRIFGSDYLAYRSRTGRWLSLPPIHPRVGADAPVG